MTSRVKLINLKDIPITTIEEVSGDPRRTLKTGVRAQNQFDLVISKLIRLSPLQWPSTMDGDITMKIIFTPRLV